MDDLVYDWDRHRYQSSFIWDRSRFAVWLGGRGSTKTSSAVFRWLTLFKGQDWTDTGITEQPDKYRGARFFVLAPVSKQLKGGPLEKFDEIIEPTGLMVKRVNGNNPRRELVNGITIFGFNVGPQGEGIEATRGMEFAGGWLDEAAQMPEKTYALANALLRQKPIGGKAYPYQLMITTTPRGQNWVDRRFLKNPPANAFVIRSGSQDSVDAGFLPKDYIDNLGYPPGSLMYRQEVLGEVVSWAGLVYPDFDTAVHVENPKELPAFKTVYGGVDVGTVDPTAILLCGITNENHVWIFKEYYQPRAKFHEWVDLVVEWSRQFNVRRWYADSDLVVRMLKGAGLRARTPYKAQDAAGVAVNYITSKLQTRTFSITPNCRSLISEMESYEYKDTTTGDEPTILSRVKERQADHALDAMRYAVLPLSSAEKRDDITAANMYVTARYG